ncbi:hypothetical protein EJ05DRAFT_142041 [Pseudovirgaria hyperparasitica]|uniref:Secreted protein n=1 Tax=Pseudovirgaria hyperparasitica TaxID=470096 RepID=A0A6A6VWB2_9PEZI|nr:uncharacterized protein EJ05DRAFT_142041 [Pseudovirgaria hyperparasitica]KAF2754455.1 hypothetical protein EJ05DRAFT_142041 [Pseudovirgaria hyperparasitica]
MIYMILRLVFLSGISSILTNCHQRSLPPQCNDLYTVLAFENPFYHRNKKKTKKKPTESTKRSHVCHKRTAPASRIRWARREKRESTAKLPPPTTKSAIFLRSVREKLWVCLKNDLPPSFLKSSPS